jgi:hypothetical protein
MNIIFFLLRPLSLLLQLVKTLSLVSFGFMLGLLYGPHLLAFLGFR